MLVACCSSTYYLALPISLNSLDREGVRLLSPRDSQILPKPACRCRWVRADDATKLRRSSMKILSFVLFYSSWSVVEPSWGRSGTLSHLGFFFYFGSVVGPWLYLDDVILIHVIVWSGDCKPTMYLFPLCITWVVWSLPHLRHCFQCGYASKSCFDTWEI